MTSKAARPNRHELIRRHNEALVLGVIGSALHPVSQAAIAKQTGLSRPTVNLLVDDLCQTGLIQEAGTRTGVVGRPASLVEVNPEFGAVAAIAVSPNSITVAVSDLTARIRSEVSETLSRSASLVDTIDSLLDASTNEAGIKSRRIRAFCVSEPGVATGTGVPRALAPNLPELDDAWLQKHLTSRGSVPILFDNDVNLAAIGEQRFGVAQGEPSYAFLLIDTGIGMGLMVNGEVWRGVHGAAGEAGYLPIGEGPFTGKAARVGAFELQAGTRGFLNRFRTTMGKPRASLKSIWTSVDEGDLRAIGVVDEEADLISRAVLSTVALLDPAFVVLGGEIGSHPAISAAVNSRIASIAPYPVDVRTSTLGDRAPVLGALATALDVARQDLGLPALSHETHAWSGE